MAWPLSLNKTLTHPASVIHKFRSLPTRQSVAIQMMEIAKTWSDLEDVDLIEPITATRMITDLLSIFESVGCLWAPHIVPAADRSLQAEWDTPYLEILYLIDSNGSRSIYVEDRVRDEVFEADGDAAYVLATRFAAKLVSGQTVPSSPSLHLSKPTSPSSDVTGRVVSA